jgi:broad specificity phosphatase PhoE
MADNFCTIYYVRHGETVWNAEGRRQGYGDSPLTEAGIKQAEELAQRFKDVHFDAVFSSDLLRAHRTAQIIVQERELAIELKEVLRERNYGIHEGTPEALYAEAMKDFNAYLETLSDAEKFEAQPPDGVESEASAVGRFTTFIREIAILYPGKTILVAGHGTILSRFLVHVGHDTREKLLSTKVRNGAWMKLRCDGVDFFIDEVNN